MTAVELKGSRLRLGLSQSQMADALSTPIRTYQGWESDRYKIPGVVSLAVNCLSKHRAKSPKNRA